MAMSGDEIKRLIEEGVPGAQVEMTDLAGDNDHWKAVVVSPAFEGLSRVRQHQMVYEALGGRMGGELHALQLITKAPAKPSD